MPTPAYVRPCVANNPGYVPGEQPRPGAMVKLNTNENPWPPSPAVAEVLKNWDYTRLKFYPDPACRELREAAAEVWNVPVEKIVMGNGSDESLAQLFHALVGPGERVVFCDPTYTYYETLARLLGAEMVQVPCSENYVLPAPGELASREGKLTFIASPNPPIGTPVPLEYIETVCELRMGKGVVAVDEAYADFAGTSAMPLLERFENLVVVRTLSKSYSLAGMRVGFALCNEPILEAMQKIRDPLNIDMLAQATARAALLDQAHMQANVAKVVAERDRVRDELIQLGFTVPESQGNFVFAWHERLSGEEVFQQLRARQVLVRYFRYERVSRGVRITIGTPEENDRLLAAAREVV